MRTQRAIKLKIGKTLPAGLPVEFREDRPWLCIVTDGNDEYQVRVTSAFHEPSLEEMEEYVADGICPSIAGDSVEPDGWDSHRTPSWLLALKLI
jgi:hypothetical protein